ncbi:MAG: hypothetical protein AAGF12_18700 [Myxococcota bacterium]
MIAARGVSAIAMAVALLGCSVDAEDSARRPTGPDGGSDADPLRDGAAAVDASPAPMTPKRGLPARNAFLDVAENGTSCYNAASFRCDGAPCQELRSCCVGNGRCCSEVPGSFNQPIDFGTCMGSPVATCLSDRGIPSEGFGPAQPFVEADGALAPGGTRSGEAGLFVGDPVDLRTHRLEVSARFLRPTNCPSPCLESAGFGVSTQAASPMLIPRPVAALVYSGARDDVALVVGDSVIKRWPLGDPEERWTLDFDPAGELRVSQGATLQLTSEHRARGPARTLLYGRNENPSATDRGARLLQLAAQASVCDMPSAWGERSALALTTSGQPWEVVAEGPSILEHESEVFLAVTVDNEIHVGTQSGAMSFEFPSPDVPALGASLPLYAAGGVGDPELIRADSGFTMYFTAIGAGGERSIGMATSEDGANYQAAPDPLIPPTGTILGIEQPTAVLHETGEIVMVVRVTEANGSYLAVYRDITGMLRPAENSALPSLTTADAEDQLAFDRQELSHPTLVVWNGAWQLFYTGRNGLRRAQGHLVSDDLIGWRAPVPSEPVLLGQEEGFDRVGVTGGDVMGGELGLRFVYLGDDGVRRTLGWIERRATDSGVLR